MRRGLARSSPLTFALLTSLIGIVVIQPSVSRAQGCSDGGLCTIAELEPGIDKDLSGVPIRLNAGVSYGSGQFGLQVITPTVGVSMQFREAFGLDVKLTANSIVGELGSNSGLGDLYSTLSWHPAGFGKGASLFVGLKQPLTGSDAQSKGYPLPMDYQTTLGTKDLLAGASWKVDRYEVGIGWQRSLQDHNDNTFIRGPLPDIEAKKYPTTYHYSRSGDLLLRVSATYPLLDERFHLTPSLLPIFHYEEDSHSQPNAATTTLDGSKGWTVNLNFYGSWKWTDKTTVGASFGAPMLARSSRPDGLTREFVLGLHVSRSL